MQSKRLIRLGSQLFDLDKGLVMGIVNATPDSFYSASRAMTADQLHDKVTRMVEDGVDILDVGAVSTRPGAANVNPQEEWSRLAPVLEFIRREFPETPLSIDTYRSEIVRKSFDQYGITMVNDISAGLLDANMPATLAELQIPVVLMHMQNQPANMQENPVYRDVTQEILLFLARQCRIFREAGVHDIVIDPGFGFGKTLQHNYQLMHNLERFVDTGYPVLVGISRKSMIYKSLNIGPDEALPGTIALNAIARMKGAQIFRVHDVREARESINLADLVNRPDLIVE